MSKILIFAILSFLWTYIHATSVTFHNKTTRIIDISVQSYATLEPFKELLCYVDDIKPKATASCHIPANRCVGAIFVHPGASTKQTQKLTINPSDTCRDFEFTISEYGGTFSISEY